MGWDRKRGGRRYYYHAYRDEDGKAVKVYVGPGQKGEKAAELDLEIRLQRQTDQCQWDAVLANIEHASRLVDQLVFAGSLMARAALVASGYYLHRGHEWRRRGNANVRKSIIPNGS